MKNKRKLAQVYVDLEAIYDRLVKLAKDAGEDERDALKSAETSVSDACCELTHVVDLRLAIEIKGKS